MKKRILALVIVAVTICTVQAQDKIIPAKDLPKEIQTYISTHFPKENILQVEKERDGLKTTYEVSLHNLTKLEFTSQGKIFDIDGKTKLPDSVIPAKILAYAKSKHPENFIKAWEKDSRKQKIELNNGLELEFSLKGDFMRYDD